MLMVDSAQGDANNCGGMGATLLQEQENGTTKPIGFQGSYTSTRKITPPFCWSLALPSLVWSTFTITSSAEGSIC